MPFVFRDVPGGQVGDLKFKFDYFFRRIHPLSYKNYFLRVAGITNLLLALSFAQPAMCQTRITGAVNNSERVRLSGTTPSFLAQSTQTGRVAGSENSGRMLLLLAP